MFLLIAQSPDAPQVLEEAVATLETLFQALRKEDIIR
jgi:hypothetical protein